MEPLLSQSLDVFDGLFTMLVTISLPNNKTMSMKGSINRPKTT